MFFLLLVFDLDLEESDELDRLEEELELELDSFLRAFFLFVFFVDFNFSISVSVNFNFGSLCFNGEGDELSLVLLSFFCSLLVLLRLFPFLSSSKFVPSFL